MEFEAKNIFGDAKIYTSEDLKNVKKLNFITKTSDCSTCKMFIPLSESQNIINYINRHQYRMEIIDLDDEVIEGVCTHDEIKVIERRLTLRSCKLISID